MKLINQIILATLAVTLGACGGGGGSTQNANALNVAIPSSFIGSDSGPATYYLNAYNQGVAPIKVSSATNPDTSGVWSVDVSACPVLQPGKDANCIKVTFDATKVTSAKQLNNALTISFMNADTTSKAAISTKGITEYISKALNADGGNVQAPRDVDLNPQQQVIQVNGFISTAATSSSQVRRSLEQARSARDVVKILCLDDKLTQINVANRSLQERYTSLQTAADRNDKDISQHEFTLATVFKDRVTQLEKEANQCIGEEGGYIGDSKVTVDIDPNTPDIDTTDFSSDPLVSSPPVITVKPGPQPLPTNSTFRIIRPPVVVMYEAQGTKSPTLDYNSGVVDFMGESSAKFSLINRGAGVLAGINVALDSATANLIKETDDCKNVPANSIQECNVILSTKDGKPNTNSFTATITGLNADGSKITTPNGGPIAIAVAGQALSVSQPTINLYTAPGGCGKVTTQAAITNIGQHDLTYTLPLSVGNFTVEPDNCGVDGTDGTLKPLHSCVFNITYNAPITAETAIHKFTVAGISDGVVQVPQSTTVTASSSKQSWVNTLNGASAFGYTDDLAGVMALDYFSNGLLFSTSMPSGVSGARNVWNNPIAQSYENLTGGTNPSFSNYSHSAPMAIIGDNSNFTTGNYNGAIQNCKGATCTTVFTPANDQLGITSLVKLSNGSAYASYSDKTTGTTGQLLFSSSAMDGPYSVITGVTGAVGRIGNDETNAYVPIHNLNTDGVLAVYSDGGNLISANIAPKLISGEFITVAYAKGNALYIGTSQGNVYQATITGTVQTPSWTKLTAVPLNSTTVEFSPISEIVLDSTGNLYVGLLNINSPGYGSGAVYKLIDANGTKVFSAEYGLCDNSSVSSMGLDSNGKLGVATYKGGIWQPK